MAQIDRYSDGKTFKNKFVLRNRAFRGIELFFPPAGAATLASVKVG